MLFLSFASILLLIGLVLFGGNNVLTLKNLSITASDLLVKWNVLGAKTQDILLNRSGPAAAGRVGLHAFQRDWIAKAREFDYSLEELRSSKRLSLLRPEWQARLDSISALWAITYLKLIAAEKDLGRIIESGLDSKVFPGLIYNFYTKRDREDLSFDDIVLLMNFMNEIAILDISSSELNHHVEEIAGGIRSESEEAINRILVFSVCLILVFFLTIVIVLRIQRDYVKLRAQRSLMEEDARAKTIRGLLLGPPPIGSEQTPPKTDAPPHPIALDAPLLLFLFRVNRLYDFCARHNGSERNAIISSAIKLIGREAEARSMEAVGADFDSHIVFIMNSAGQDLQRGYLEQFAAEINEKTSRSLGIRFSTTGCHVPEGGSGLSGAYLKAVQASNYRFTKGPDSLLWADETFTREPDAYVYPIEGEKRLCNALKEGRQAEAWQHYKAISAEASSFTYSVAQSVVLRLSLAVGTTIELMERGLGSKMHTDVGSFISRVSALETMEEVDFAFNDVFRSVRERLDEARRSKNLLLVTTMDGIIDREYRNPNLSLDLIADECKLSPSYAGRIYRKIKSKSVSEAINEKRLKVMAALLMEKNISIRKIAAHIGIANYAYIYKLFKRAYGLTPNEYRRQEVFTATTDAPIGSG